MELSHAVPAIEAVDLYRFFHAGEAETLALRGVSIALHPGELVALVGPSGSGKSTLMACLAGLDEPDGGHVDVLGERLSRRPETERARRRASSIGILLQSGNLFEGLSVEGNIRLQQRLAGRADPARIGALLAPARIGALLAPARIDALLASVGLTERRDAAPGQLSGGEAARAGLAVALAAAPAVLLADEPTGEVDAQTEAQILDLLLQACRDGMAALVATHSPALAARASRVVRIEDGRISA